MSSGEVLVRAHLVQDFQHHWVLVGAIFTFVLYGCLPLSSVMYLLGTPMRRRARLAAEARQMSSAAEAAASSVTAPQTAPVEASAAQPDGGGLAPGDAVAPKREER